MGRVLVILALVCSLLRGGTVFACAGDGCERSGTQGAVCCPLCVCTDECSCSTCGAGECDGEEHAPSAVPAGAPVKPMALVLARRVVDEIGGGAWSWGGREVAGGGVRAWRPTGSGWRAAVCSWVV